MAIATPGATLGSLNPRRGHHACNPATQCHRDTRPKVERTTKQRMRPSRHLTHYCHLNRLPCLGGGKTHSNGKSTSKKGFRPRGKAVFDDSSDWEESVAADQRRLNHRWLAVRRLVQRILAGYFVKKATVGRSLQGRRLRAHHLQCHRLHLHRLHLHRLSPFNGRRRTTR